MMPQEKIDIESSNLPPLSDLADPALNVPGKIDLLLGAEVFYEILKGKAEHLTNNIWLHSSELGVLVAGSFSPETKPYAYVAVTNQNHLLQSLCEDKQIEPNSILSLEVDEEHCNNYASKLETNQYQVAPQHHENVNERGEPRSQAKATITLAERRKKDFFTHFLQLGESSKSVSTNILKMFRQICTVQEKLIDYGACS